MSIGRCSLLALGIAVAGCGGPPDILSASVASNPNNALSARVEVRTTGVTDVSVRYAIQGTLANGAPRTPHVTVGGQPTVVPVLGLSPGVTYDMEVVATTVTGTSLTSSLGSFTAGQLPPGLPTFTVADAGYVPGGFTMLAPVVGAATDAGWPPAVVVDGTGAVVWYYPLTGQLLDFQKQASSYTVASGGGQQQINSLGEVLHTWSASGSATDGHEARLFASGACAGSRAACPLQALLFGYDTRSVDLSSMGGQSQTPVLGTVVQRVDQAGKVLFHWSPFDWIALSDLDDSIPRVPSVAPGTATSDATVDWTHGNAMDVADDGNYLVSLRNVSTVVKIDSTTGAILWHLGGKSSDFTFAGDPLGGPSMQHGVRELPNGHLLMFDNGNEHTPPQSRAVEYALDTTQKVATAVWSFEPQPSVFASAMGFAQRLPDGNTLVNFGTLGSVQEVDPEGQVVWKLTSSTSIYRAFRIDSLY